MHVRVPNLAKTGILVADTQLLKEAFSVRPSIRPLVMFESKSGKTSIWILLVYDCVWGVGNGVWMGVGHPCPLIRNDIMTLRNLFSFA